jgi:hypothetical protein
MAKLQSVNSVAGKETIYVDVDDEITAIIDKVDVAKGKVVALVLPKRCPVLQSVVNMKLLKRTADNGGKNLVLITSEAGLMPLAGATGLYVASTPISKPAIPHVPGPAAADDGETLEEPLHVVDGNVPGADVEGEDFNPKTATDKSVGELAAGGKKSSLAPLAEDETIDMAAEDEAEAAATPVAKPEKPKKDKKLHVPNFDSFRKRIALGALALILLIAAALFALVVLPKATITIATDSSTIPTNLTLNLDTTATKLDPTNDIVPATSQSQQKTATQTVPATGQQNNGQKASGQVTIQLKDCNTSTVTVPTGSGISSGSQTYITQSDVTLNSVTVGHQCNPTAFQNLWSATVNVIALKGGASYNIPNGSSFTLPSSIAGASDTAAKASSDIAGGTDNITTIVQQSDIDSATSKIAASDSTSIRQQLESNLESKGLQPVAATFLAGAPQVTTSAKAGDQVSNVTVTSVTTYSMLGVQRSDLQTLVRSNVNSQLDKGKQVILDDGVANAQFAEANPGTSTSATVAMTVKSQAGPQLDVTSLKQQLAGKRSADVASYVQQTPGVTNVTVKYSPFWVDTVPSKANKVTIRIVKGS